jgi:hypothetical protein
MTYTSVNQALIAANLQVKSATHLLVAQNADDHETRILASTAAIADGTTGNGALGTRVSALEAVKGNGYWKYSGTPPTAWTGYSVAAITGWTVQGSATGISNSGAAFTVTAAGTWLIQASLRKTTDTFYTFIGKGSTPADATASWGTNSAQGLECSVTAIATLGAGESFYIWMFNGSSGTIDNAANKHDHVFVKAEKIR